MKMGTIELTAYCYLTVGPIEVELLGYIID